MSRGATLGDTLFGWISAGLDAVDVGLEALDKGVELGAATIGAATRAVVLPLTEAAAEMLQDLSELADGSPSAEGEVATSSVAAEVVEVVRGESWVQQYEGLDSGEAAISEEELAARGQMAVGAATAGAAALWALTPAAPLALLTGAGVVYQVRYTYQRAWERLRAQPGANLDVLNSATITIAMLSGSLGAMALACALSSFKKWVTTRTEGKARRSITAAFSQQPREAWLRTEAGELRVPVEQLTPGDVVVVSPGEVVPVDGEVLSGMTSVDERMLTGESKLAEKGPGELLLAGTLLLRGRVELSVLRSGEETVVAQIAATLADTSGYKKVLRSRAEEANDRLLLPYIAMGALAWPLWGTSTALAVLWSMPTYNMITLAPLTMLSFMHLTSRQGILVKTGRALEDLRDVDTLVFDKTGTLTTDTPEIGRTWTFSQRTERELLTLAATAERAQTHPIALAILARAEALGLECPEAEGQALSLGFGVSVQLGGAPLFVGSERLMQDEGVTLGERALEAQRDAHARGHGLVFVAHDGELVGALEICPSVRPEAAEVIAELKRRGYRTVILSGDHEAPTRALAGQLGVHDYRAQVLPQDKSAVIEALQAEGARVCFVGDGINDALALERAEVSVSLKGATAVATTVADVILMSGTLQELLPLLDIAARFEDRMRVNRLAASVPAFVSITGAFTLGWGFMAAVVLNQGLSPLAYYNSLVQPVVVEESRKAAS
ncbi:MAG: heavy metal translocating P-type ATPase [Alphaproteobacteria bacterium]|nr:heavy metal translocating P-type ATPase [Alphaproteobacteria bacterium]MCB9792401.1 heavy metal translocating P-type ATPase [Alphaproteobacteria bacterium]